MIVFKPDSNPNLPAEAMKEREKQIITNALASFNWWGKEFGKDDDPNLRYKGYVEALEKWESDWDEHFNRVNYLPDDLLAKAKELTRVEEVLSSKPFYPDFTDVTLKVFIHDLLEDNDEGNWTIEQLLVVCGLTQEDLDLERERLKTAASLV